MSGGEGMSFLTNILATIGGIFCVFFLTIIAINTWDNWKFRRGRPVGRCGCSCTACRKCV